jgi:hypothetical protein
MDMAHSNRIRELCSLIQAEQDPQKFISLIEELNRILSHKGTPPLQSQEQRR